MFKPNYVAVALHPTLNPSPAAIAVTLVFTAVKCIPKVIDTIKTISSTIELSK